MFKKILIKIIIPILIIAWAITATVFVGIKTSKVHKLEKEVAAITEEYNNFKGDYEREISAAQAEIEIRDKTITEQENKITELNNKITSLNNQITTLKKK